MKKTIEEVLNDMTKEEIANLMVCRLKGHTLTTLGKEGKNGAEHYDIKVVCLDCRFGRNLPPWTNQLRALT